MLRLHEDVLRRPDVSLHQAILSRPAQRCVVISATTHSLLADPGFPLGASGPVAAIPHHSERPPRRESGDRPTPSRRARSSQPRDCFGHKHSAFDQHLAFPSVPQRMCPFGTSVDGGSGTFVGMDLGDAVEVREGFNGPYVPGVYLGEAAPFEWRDPGDGEMRGFSRVKVRYNDGREKDVDVRWVRPLST
jgi:hypothetical protein